MQNTKKFIKLILPTPAEWFSFIILPLIFGLYFVITQYSNKFIATQNISYFDVQNNILGTFFLSQAWVDWLNRFMDFAFWGVLAGIAILIWWGISMAKTSIFNHKTEEQFANFKVSKKSWNHNFVTVAIIKIILVMLMVYSVFMLIARAIPQFATGVANCILILNQHNVWLAVKGALLMILFQALFIACLHLIRLTRAD